MHLSGRCAAQSCLMPNAEIAPFDRQRGNSSRTMSACWDSAYTATVRDPIPPTPSDDPVEKALPRCAVHHCH